MLLPKGVSLAAEVRVGNAASEIAKCAGAVKAELVVMGQGGGRALRDAFLGSTAERVVRGARIPVPVVRTRARARYRRPAVELDFDQAAREALGALLRVSPAPRPAVSIIHVLLLGTHGHAGIAHAFLGTVAGDVLREVACDVLVAPPRRIGSGTA